MAQRKSGELKSDSDLAPGEDVPTWQKRSVERSLQSARLRAQKRSDRFVAAALELIAERENGDFTIQDVVDRSTMSPRTFYAFFDGKDSLLLAVYETILSKTAVPMLRQQCEGQADPVLRVRALFDALFEITALGDPLSRALSVFHLRLVRTHPDDLAHALEPLHSFITELLTDVAAAGRLRDDLELSTLAAMLQEMLLAHAHSAVLAGGRQTSVDDLWAFCSAAILRQSAVSPASAG
jgi:AcrR family transcriptional regulator